MQLVRRAYRRLQALLTRTAIEQDMDDEMRLHMDLLAEDYERSGMSREAASRAARRRFGNLNRIQEQSRDIRGAGILEDLKRDLLYAARALRRSPIFTAVVTLSLALGIGANTSLFTVIDAAFLRKLPVEAPDELVFFRWTSGPSMTPFEPRVVGSFMRFGPGILDGAPGFSSSQSFSGTTFEQFRRDAATLSHVFAFAFADASVTIAGQPETAIGELVSGNYFDALKVPAIAGRTMTREDDQAAAEPVAVISHAYWQRRFALDPSAIGREIIINGVPMTIVGVTPPEFRGIRASSRVAPDLTIPLAFGPQLKGSVSDPDTWWLQIMGRMKAGATIEQVRGNLEGIFQATASSTGQQAIPRLEVLSGSRGWRETIGPLRSIAELLAILSVVSGLLLLIVCVNAANLLVARGAARHYEIAVRLSMGASRLRVIRQLLTESVLLACIGGGLGLLLSFWGKDLLRSTVGAGFDLRIDPRVLGFAALISLVTGTLFGLAPALRTTRMDLNSAVKQRGRYAGGRFLLAKVLLVSQVAMSVVLLMGTGLLLRTIGNWQDVDPGFNTENLLLFSVRPEALQYDAGRIFTLYEAMSERIGAVSGVRAVTRSDYPLVSSQGSGRARIRARSDDAQPTFAHVRSIRFNFLETMDIPLLAGRNLVPADDQSSNRVAVVTETLARRLFPNRNPIGGRFVFMGNERMGSEDVEIVGVTKDVRASTDTDMLGIVFLSALQRGTLQAGPAGTHIEVRTAGDPLLLVPAIREAIREIDPNLALSGIRTMDQEIDRGSSRARSLVPIWSIFGLVAALLTCIGLFGLMSYNVTRRTNEIGIRIALGARRLNVARLVTGQMLLLVSIGVGIGLAGSFIANQALRTAIFGVTLYDPVTIVAVLAMLFGVTAVAGYHPVRRASRVDPTVALRYE